MTIFNIHDIIEFAIHIEENGEAFYRQAAKTVSDKAAQELFIRLADDETGHKKVFETMKKTIGDYQPNETYDGEYTRYLRDYIDEKVIFKKKSVETAVDGLSAINTAIQKEMDSVLYYLEVKRFVAERHHEAINRIIEEERKHFERLSEARKRFT